MYSAYYFRAHYSQALYFDDGEFTALELAGETRAVVFNEYATLRKVATTTQTRLARPGSTIHGRS